jgi:phosphate transport system protein
MRLRFDEQLKILHRELITMGSMCETAISSSVSALTGGDLEKARKVSDNVDDIDRKERDIEDLCVKLLLQQQPVAGDLRTITAALKMVTDMRRIADQAGDISEIVLTGRALESDNTLEIDEMAKATVTMVVKSIDAFVSKDEAAANRIIKYDDVVDEHFDRVKNLLIDRISSGRTPAEYAMDILMIAKYLERIGDHAENIARWVIYSISGAIDEVK